MNLYTYTFTHVFMQFLMLSMEIYECIEKYRDRYDKFELPSAELQHLSIHE